MRQSERRQRELVRLAISQKAKAALACLLKLEQVEGGRRRLRSRWSVEADQELTHFYAALHGYLPYRKKMRGWQRK